MKRCDHCRYWKDKRNMGSHNGIPRWLCSEATGSVVRFDVRACKAFDPLPSLDGRSKKLARCLVLMLVAVLMAALLAATAPAEAQSVRIVDGDTIALDGEKFRLYGIDAPESDQPYGSEAEAALRALMIRAKNLLVADVDRWGRKIAIIELRDGSTVQEHLVRNGDVWYYEKYCKRKEYCNRWQQLERSARDSRAGLWSSASPVAPWAWRRQ